MIANTNKKTQLLQQNFTQKKVKFQIKFKIICFGTNFHTQHMITGQLRTFKEFHY